MPAGNECGCCTKTRLTFPGYTQAQLDDERQAINELETNVSMVRKDIVQGTHEFRGETFDVKEIVNTKSKYIDTYHEATFKPIHVLARLHNYTYHRGWRNALSPGCRWSQQR